MNMPEKMELQRKEFNAANAFAKALGQHNRTPIVDDDYPEVRRQYEGALAGLIEAMRANGRFEVGNRYGLSAPASPQGVSAAAGAAPEGWTARMIGGGAKTIAVCAPDGRETWVGTQNNLYPLAQAMLAATPTPDAQHGQPIQAPQE